MNGTQPAAALNYTEIMAMLQELGMRFKELESVQKETALQMKETDRKMKETDRQMKETDRKISKLGDRLGDLVEHIIAPNLMEKFNDKGFKFEKIAPNVIFKLSNGKFVEEVDILLEGVDTVMAVEVKSKLTTLDVKEHILRMKNLRDYADGSGDKRQFMGAVAGAIIPENVKPFAQKNGFYVIEQTGDTVRIDIPEGFVPRKW